MPLFQDLSRFRVPSEFRGRSAVVVQSWWLVQSFLFGGSPQFAYGFRRCLLRIFGASIGKGVLIRPTAKFTYPWKVRIGDYAWVGDNVVVYSLGEIEIGSHAVVSQRSYLCSGDHDYSRVDFPIRSRKITIGSEAWLGTDVFVAPGVEIGAASVIGARSSVFADMPEEMVCFGSPCRPIKKRELATDSPARPQIKPD